MSWEELMDEKQGKGLGPTEWSCNCLAPRMVGREKIFTKMYPTEVDQDQLCIHCGHYAFKIESYFFEMVKQRSKNFKYKKRKVLK